GREGLEGRGGPAGGRADADDPRPRPGRGPGAGRAGPGPGAVAGVGRPGQPGRLAHGRVQAARDRLLPAGGAAARADAVAGRGARRARPGRRRRRHRRRRAAADVHVLPPGAQHRDPGGAHPPARRRAEHPGDRPRVPVRRGHRRPADQPGQADPGRGRRAVRGADRAGAAGAARLGAGGRLPDLQRGLLGDGRGRLDPARPVPGGAPAGPPAGRAGAAGAGGARPGRAAGAAGVPVAGAGRAGRLAGAAHRPGPRPLGPRADRVRAGRAAPGDRHRAVRAAGGHRGLPRGRPVGAGDRLGPDRLALRHAGRVDRVAGGGAEPGGRGVPRVRSGGGPGDRRPARGGPGAARLPPAAQRARRPAGVAGPARREPGGVHPGRRHDHERAGARAAAGPGGAAEPV
ncbi:MAG: RNA polymerase ECF-type sigma factor, partial [uncultured Corynebacteriales bacterium]